jgi:RNA polymerase sigma-70 factor (ECF subfamily)
MEASTSEPISEALSRDAVFDRLVTHELAAAYRTASLLLRDEAEAEDATQEAMLRAWQRIDQLHDPARAGGWFGRILVNVCRDRLRRRQPGVVAWSPPAGQEPSRDIAEREAIASALAELTPDQQIVVVLRFYLDLSLDMIAERTGAPLGTVKTRLHHGLRAVRAAYEAAERINEVPR